MSDEFLHIIKQQAAQQQNDYRSFLYGHISSYDPGTQRVRVIFPSLRGTPQGPGQGGTMFTSPWMPLGSPWAGQNCGLQVAPLNQSATEANLNGGDQVLVCLIERTAGVVVASCMLWNDQEMPPSPSLDTPLNAGEAVLRHASGSFMRFHQNGDIEINTQGNTLVTAQQNCEITTEQKTTVNAANDIDITSATVVNITAPEVNIGNNGGTLHKIVTDAFQAIYNEHVHGDSGPPSPQMTSSQLTSIVNMD